MLKQQSAFASSSSGRPSQLKRPRTAGADRVWNWSKRNRMSRSWLMGNVVRRVVREEWERVKADLAEYCHSSMGKTLNEMVQEISSMKNAVHGLMETVELTNCQSPHLNWANGLSKGKNDLKNLRLQIQTKPSDPLFTGKKLEGEGGACISVALINANAGDIVRSGPESSIKLDVVVLEGDFNKDNEENWAQEEFENCVVKEREGKGPLLTGDLQVTLREGVGVLGDLIFTDNSSWIRSKRFRIGLKVASSYCGNARIREAKTDAFRVKEHRGESNKKHHPPASDDDVWRLEKIAKDGVSHRKLSEAGIHKVEDFLQQLSMDRRKLKNVLGTSITLRNWECLIAHAITCTNWKPHLDSLNGIHATVFNTDRLTDQNQDREHGYSPVKKAFDDWNDVRKFNEETISGTMQKESSTSQVFGGQIDNLTPVQCSWAPQICASSGGAGAPLANLGLTAEGQMQNTSFGNVQEFPVDGSVLLAAHQPISADQNANFGNDKGVPLASHQPIYNANFRSARMFSVDQPITADNSNFLLSPGDNGMTTVGLPIQSHDIEFQYQMGHQMIDCLSPMGYIVNEHVLPSGPTYASTPSCQYSGACPLPEGNIVMEEFHSTLADDMMISGDDDTSFHTPLWNYFR